MVKELKAFRLRKEDIFYIQNLAKQRNGLSTQTQVIETMIGYYKDNHGFNIHVPNDYNKILYSAYTFFIPFVCGSLFAYFYIARSWAFFPMLGVAVIPFIFRIKLQDDGIKVLI